MRVGWMNISHLSIIAFDTFNSYTARRRDMLLNGHTHNNLMANSNRDQPSPHQSPINSFRKRVKDSFSVRHSGVRPVAVPAFSSLLPRLLIAQPLVQRTFSDSNRDQRSISLSNGQLPVWRGVVMWILSGCIGKAIIFVHCFAQDICS